MSFKIAISTLRTIEKSGGIDKFLIKTDHRYLSTLAKKYKKNILKKITDTAAKISQ